MKAWELIEQKGWCQQDDAHDATGKPVPITSKKAACFCALGSIDRTYGIGTAAGNAAVSKLRAFLRVRSVVDWNDDPKRTKEEVIAALKAADV